MQKLARLDNSKSTNINFSRRIFIILLAFILPIDFLSPTATLFREFGAQPVNILVLIVGIILSPNAFKQGWKNQRFFSRKYFLIGMLLLISGGFIGFIASSAFWHYTVFGNKSTIMQFILQGALITCLPISLIITRYYFSNDNVLNLFFKSMRWAAVVHFCFFIFDYIGLIGNGDWFYSMFRTVDYSTNLRPSGLFSEPSYYGVAVCLYFPFIVLGIFGKRFSVKLFWSIVLIIALVSLYLSGSRTGIIAIIIQLLVWVLLTRRSRIFKLAIFVIFFASVAFYSTQRINGGNEFDLSSIMRAGSMLLSINVAMNGWVWSGIGFGQFHFFYVPYFAPNFLFLSDEAWSFFNGTSEYRAHTFNLFTRILLETGVIGFVGWILFCRSLVIPNRRKLNTGLNKREQMLILASIGGGFLLFSQDFYLYLPFYILLVIFGQSRLATHKSST